MATLYFKVESDLQKVKDLRAEISRLEAQMKSFGRNTAAEEVEKTVKELASAKSQFASITTEAAKAGAVMESNFKQKVYAASQTINEFTRKIIEQKAVIKNIEGDVGRLGDAYAKAVKNKSPKANSLLDEFASAKQALKEEKAALFELSQQQAKARLSVKELRDEYALYKDSSKDAAEGMSDMEKALAGWGKKILAGYGLKELASQVIKVRGEFQQMETSIKTLVGESKANELIPQIKEMAKVSPLTMTDIVGAEQMMLGFNIAADDTVKYLRALSDVSMGNSQKFNSLTLAFSQMSAAGKLMGQDLNQMINAGFNPLQQISQTTGKSIAQLKKEMSTGAISAEMVQKAFIDATSAGGKFYKMSEEGSKTINGQISMMEDAMDNALNEIGKSSEGLIMAGIKGVTALVENYETVGVVLAGLVATYGLYKAALIANIALEKASQLQSIATAKGKTVLAVATDLLTKKMTILNKVMAMNPYVLITAAVIGAAAGALLLTKRLADNASSVKKLKKASEEYTQTLDDQYAKSESLMSIIADETKSQREKVIAYNQLKTLVPQITKLYSLEKLAVLELADANKLLSDAKGKDIEAGIKAEMQGYQKVVDYYDKAINRAKRSGFKDRAQKLANTEDYQNAKKELERLKALNKEVEEAAKAPEVKNKEYWEKKKKEAQSALEAMDVSMKGSKEWVALEKQIADAQKEIDKYSTSKQAKENKEESKKNETIAKIKEMKDAIIEAENQAQLEIRQAEIDSMKESTNKELAQINLNYDRKIAENEKRKKQYIKEISEQMALEWELANPQAVKKGKSFDKSTVTEANLTPDQKQILNYYDELAKKEKEIATINANKKLLEQYQSYAQKRLEIEQKFERDRNAMYKEDGSFKSGFSKANLDELNRQRNESLQVVDQEFAMRESQFETWANQVADLSLKKLEELLMQAKQELGKMERDNKMAESMGLKPKYSSGEMMMARGKVANLEGTVKDAKLSPGKRTSKDWKELYDTLNQVQGQFKDIGDTIGGVTGEIIASAGNIAGSTLTMVNNIVSLTDGSIKAIQGTSEASTKALQAVEAASLILAVVGAAVQIVTKIINLANKAHDAKYDKKIKNYQNEIDDLEKSYEKLGKAIDNAYSKTAADKLAEYNGLLERQKTLIGLQMKEEEAKKKTDKGRIESWKKEREDIDKLIEENKKKAEDAIYGEDLQSAIENFADAYADALSQNKDGWVSLRDTAKEMMRKMVMETIKQSLSGSKAIENLRDAMGQMYADDIFTQAEQDAIYKMAADIQDNLNSRFGWAEDLFKDSTSDEQKATYGGFESMSEDTGNELNGRFTALQMAGEDIRVRMIEQNVSLSEIKGSIANMYPLMEQGRSIVDEIRGMLANSILELQGINENTSANVKELKRLGVMFNKWDGKIMNL